MAASRVLLTEDDCKDVGLLLLAADVLVTQHHAALFEFPLTDRPVVLLGCGCLVRARRGSRAEAYFDLDEQPPGPVVWSPDELRERLRDLDAVRHDFRDARARWSATYATYDDGNASAAVADYVVAHLGKLRADRGVRTPLPPYVYLGDANHVGHPGFLGKAHEAYIPGDKAANLVPILDIGR